MLTGPPPKFHGTRDILNLVGYAPYVSYLAATSVVNGVTAPLLDHLDGVVMTSYLPEYYHERPEGHTEVAKAVAAAFTMPNGSGGVTNGFGGTRGVAVNSPTMLYSSPASGATNWIFGDGSQGQSIDPWISHTFTSLGTFTVEATTTNSDGVSMWTQEVRVTRDGDMVGDDADNCPDVANPDQINSNANGVGDACDSTGSAGPVYRGGASGDPHLVTLDGG